VPTVHLRRRLAVRRARLRCPTSARRVDFARGLVELGVELVSTGAPPAKLTDADLEVRAIDDYTGFPEIMDGRVKTLNPKLYAGLLAVRDDPSHAQAMTEHGIEPVDLVCVNLYPFERTAARRGVSDREVIEQIDIGGPTMIRAAAKNHAYATVVVSPASYDAVLEELRISDGALSPQTRESLAAEAFAYTARYDTSIARWFAERAEDFPDLYVRASRRSSTCPTARTRTSAPPTTRRSARAARAVDDPPAPRQAALVQQPARPRRRAPHRREFEVPACVIVKHNNPCGVGVGRNGQEAYERAFSADRSARSGRDRGQPHGRPRVRREAHEQFIEVPLRARLRRRRARAPDQKAEPPPARGQRAPRAAGRRARRPQVLGGLLVQDRDADLVERAEMEGRHRAPADRGRVGRDALRLEGVQARPLERDRARARAGHRRHRRRPDEPRRQRPAGDREEPDRPRRRGDGVRRVLPVRRRPAGRARRGRHGDHAAGGSMRDEEVVAAADAAGVTMVFTRRRHFRH
jgi:phosphoribosylaminoimidazolecarboxamide formyltransferase/IMP cyclohydrolase